MVRLVPWIAPTMSKGCEVEHGWGRGRGPWSRFGLSVRRRARTTVRRGESSTRVRSRSARPPRDGRWRVISVPNLWRELRRRRACEPQPSERMREAVQTAVMADGSARCGIAELGSKVTGVLVSEHFPLNSHESAEHASRAGDVRDLLAQQEKQASCCMARPSMACHVLTPVRGGLLEAAR